MEIFVYSLNGFCPLLCLFPWSLVAQALSCLRILTRAVGESPKASAAFLVSPPLLHMISKTCATNRGKRALEGCKWPLLPGNFISGLAGSSRTCKAKAICNRCKACILFSWALLPSQDLISKLKSRRVRRTPVLVLLRCWPPGPLPWKPLRVQARKSSSRVILR